MSLSTGKLIDRAMWGPPLSDDEIAWVANRLTSNPTFEEVWEGLYILGRTEAKTFREVVEPYLYSKDPIFAGRAFWTVWVLWRDHERYRDLALTFIRGVPWDDIEEVQVKAIGAAASYLQKHHDPEMIRAIFETYLQSDSRSIQTTAYGVLSSLLDLSPEEKKGPPTKPIIRSSVVEKIEAYVESLDN